MKRIGTDYSADAAATYVRGIDRNGNTCACVRPNRWRGFSVQTCGNLPRTHADGVGDWTAGEVRGYVALYGTARQRAALGIGGEVRP